MNTLNRKVRRFSVLSLLVAALAMEANAAVEFSTNEPGVRKGMSYWALGWRGDTETNLARIGGAGMVKAVRIGCPKEWALDSSGGLQAEAKAEVELHMAEAVKVISQNAAAGVAIVCNGGNGTHDWYLQNNGNELRGERWLAMFKAVRKHIISKYGYRIAYVEIGNEQDFNNKAGSAANLDNIQTLFQADADFAGVPLVGPSTLSSSAAARWYRPMKNSLDWGATHAIGGSGGDYIAFVKQVIADGKPYYGSEVHNLVEMIIAEEYGGLGGLWWETISPEIGQFIQLSQQGNRICYQEKPGNFSAASCYRGSNNSIHIFAASIGGDTLEFKATDRDVYFDGKGPQRSFFVTLGKGEARHIVVTMDAQSPSPNPTPSPTPSPTGGFGISAEGKLYHAKGNFSAAWNYLCLDSRCLPGSLVNGRFERSVNVAVGSTHTIEFKVQDNTAGQCFSGVRTVKYTANGVTANSACLK